MAQRLTVIRVKGDTEKLIEAMSGVDEVFERNAREHGMIFTCRARTDDGAIIVNLWPDAESSETAFKDPAVQEALSSMEALVDGPPQRDHYEVVTYRAFA